MKVSLSPLCICRTPIFPIDAELSSVWARLKIYIRESSPAFYEVIKDAAFSDYASLEPKVRFTIWKYYNRAKFRATPYGNFAAFSLLPLTKDVEAEQIVLTQQMLVHRFSNWQEREHIKLDVDWLTNHAGYFRTNTTSYLSGKELRYVSIEDGSFELSSILLEKTVQTTLAYCHIKRTLPELQHFLMEKHGLEKALCNYLVEQLLEVQLLITDQHSNIIGSDYFKRIGADIPQKDNDYLIAERTRISGTVSATKIQILLEVTDFLRKHLAVHENLALQEFKDRFGRRFENKAVPLLVAMDPETGVGYRSLTQDKNEDQLISELKVHREQKPNPILKLSYSRLHRFILNGMLQGKTVQIEDCKGEDITSDLPIANTTSCLMNIFGDQLVVDHIGGATANSLLGRFSLASDKVTAVGQHFASIEQEANPDIIFFDIGYQLEKNADNINRRKAIYEYELPLLSWSDGTKTLDPDEILVSMKGDEIILHSTRYSKRIIPKLASAYNYSRSDLAIYRFLSDLQQQNLQASLRLNMTEVFPGLIHYERIQYKNVILSPEKWLVPQHLCTTENTEQALENWLESIKLTKRFKAGFSDQHLLFDPQSREERLYFLLFCKNKTDLYIEESFVPDSPVAIDEQHNPYLPEFIVNLQHLQQIYKPYPYTHLDSSAIKSTFLPGDEWLYFEVYCHPSHSNELMLDIAANYIAGFRKKIKQWFFIRYNDPAFHIRLRLALRDLANYSELITGLSNLLKKDVQTGIISDLQIKTYRRETERYGQHTINLAEKCFAASSEFVMHLILRPKATSILYHISVKMLEHICDEADLMLEDQIRWSENMAAMFSKEMKVTADGLKKINLGYKEFQHLYDVIQLQPGTTSKLMKTAKSFLQALSSAPAEARNKLLSDLFHMHVNRLFNTDQRMHEMLIYHYFTRRLKMKAGRLKKEVGIQI